MNNKIRAYLFFRTMREFPREGNIMSRGLRCSITTTIHCPFHCSYCPMFIYGEPRKHDECTFEEWRIFLDRFPVWISAMYISGGEPSLYKDITPLVNYLVDKGHHVIIQTNLFCPEAFAGITPRRRLVFMATYHQQQEEKLNRGDKFFDNVEYLRGRGHVVISQQIGVPDKKNTRVKEYFTEKWFREIDNAIIFEPSTPRTLRMWMGCVNMYKK